ncbi:MAG: hypothetical protein COZ49_01835 [Candidatus Yonathbacteria bacterium CG_4_10_14_3_um_filter_47_65]|uniref:DUF5671 domain-containing protein n=2 Tax=Parcubacteria group TaxID=1794811 RepID=A0A2M8D6P6_9BACT|nr:MAG: hypothetical protein AUJ44_03665 [Candidatus Nomurabacteria bacterium CG1_02_47_685]PIP03373.1 MAG: hypothetical protein COX54_03970 [Candidatus Yonathbacteria bacterium CG23_combo_of_CG06-09_8_20_14_all_46_18]PIQ32597.1 MAG: hypothetical protein COW61_01355 [Candidatus Yonathbacteria bacterium CG17_big_fil_post_rev_8_21_14_2_50_46_19]PIX56484.1 MAG: hypothetical protein COZ49_01835 [Candidatus Yonathbacteria bacterium CG_4_10_14_3_um_filter_47_65]PIY57272.1 MAG: hypothetical protein CO
MKFQGHDANSGSVINKNTMPKWLRFLLKTYAVILLFIFFYLATRLSGILLRVKDFSEDFSEIFSFFQLSFSLIIPIFIFFYRVDPYFRNHI